MSAAATDADIHREYARRMLRYKLDREPTDEEIDRMLSPDAAGRPVRSGWRRAALSSRTR